MPIRPTMTIPCLLVLLLLVFWLVWFFSDAPPSRDEVTTSRTCADSTDVKIFTSSGMIAPASVPQVITVESFHQSDPSPRSLMRRYERTYVSTTEMIDVSHTSAVSGASKFIFAALA